MGQCVIYLCGFIHEKYLWIKNGQVVLAVAVTAAMDASLHSKELTWQRQNERMQHGEKSYQSTTTFSNLTGNYNRR